MKVSGRGAGRLPEGCFLNFAGNTCAYATAAGPA